MRFLVDECAGPAVAELLYNHGHEVTSVASTLPGAEDERVLRQAVIEQRIIVTADTDFGDRVFREKMQHRGIVLLRLRNQRRHHRVAAMARLLERKPAIDLQDRFIVVSDAEIRISRTQQ